LRIITQFGDQIFYLITYRRFLPWGVAHIFLIVNVCVFVPGGAPLTYPGNVEWKLHGHRKKTL
jgi:hypothetical protein